jgi:hypothetical protein
MKRLVFLVEGSTEIVFMKEHVIPYLYRKGHANPMQVQKIITNRKLNIKGGNISYQYLKNDIERVTAQGNVLITTFLDFFRLPTDFPGYTSQENKVAQVEEALHQEFGKTPYFLPYIQLHEVEAVMFSNLNGFEVVIDKDDQLQRIKKITQEYNNPEDINTRPELAPSKRMWDIFRYDKGADAEIILKFVGIQDMIAKCPRFANWLIAVENLLQQP